MDQPSTDATGLAQAIRVGELTAHEVVEQAIKRIEKRDPLIRAVVGTRFDEALNEVSAGLPEGPFTGVPTMIKDLNADVAGLPSTGGSRLFAGYRARRDSELVARYRAAGLVVLGTTNTPEFGKNASTEPVLYGATSNPWSSGHSPGGSSGGSAAAVAAGMVPVAHGNDGAGSIRIPASMCGLFGLKPTRGRTPGAPYSNGMANPVTAHHVLTTSVRDSAALLDVGAGPGPAHPTGLMAPGRSFAAEAADPTGKLRIAMSTVAADGTEADPACAGAVARTASLCARLGHEIVEARPVYDAISVVLASSTVMRANLVATVESRLAELGRPLRDDDLEPFTHVMLEGGRSATAASVIEAFGILESMARTVASFMEGYDLVLTPTLARTVPELGTLDTTSPEVMYERAGTYAVFTGICNVTGQPAMSIPAGVDGSGLPVGVQFAAGHGAESLLLRLATQLEQAQPWPALAPDYR